MSIKKNANALRQKREKLLDSLLDHEPMIPGSIKEVYRKCGKPSCWCVEEQGHPYVRITWTEQGVSKTKAISKENIAMIRNLTQNYRKFKQKRRQVNELDKAIKKIFDQLERQSIEDTREGEEKLKE